MRKTRNSMGKWIETIDKYFDNEIIKKYISERGFPQDKQCFELRRESCENFEEMIAKTIRKGIQTNLDALMLF